MGLPWSHLPTQVRWQNINDILPEHLQIKCSESFISPSKHSLHMAVTQSHPSTFCGNHALSLIFPRWLRKNVRNLQDFRFGGGINCRATSSTRLGMSKLPEPAQVCPMGKNGIRWPISRVLFTTEVDRRPFLWDDDYSSPRATDPEDGVKTRHKSSLFGLAPGGVYLARSVARSAVRSYRTLSPLPRRIGAVCFLWHFPSARTGRALPAALSAWSPDFPPSRFLETAAARPSDPDGQIHHNLPQGYSTLFELSLIFTLVSV